MTLIYFPDIKQTLVVGIVIDTRNFAKNVSQTQNYLLSIQAHILRTK
jgi:hypothetical protein